MKTPVRWAGSKKALLPTLRQYWRSEHKRYVEPFCGSACLFFDLEPKKAVLSDINAELIEMYLALKHEPVRVLECLSKLRSNKKNYYKLRSIDPHSLPRPELAARFLFLNKLSFNGIYRTNRQGHFNVPYAKPKNRTSFDIEGILALSSALQRASLRADDFEAVLDDARRGDFVYLDPPYAVSGRRVFAEYHAKTFSTDDIVRLRKSLTAMDGRGVHFVVSYADSQEGRLLTSDWNRRRIRARRNVAGFSGDRRIAYEILASNMELRP